MILFLSEAFPPETAAILFLGNFEKPFCFKIKTKICLNCQVTMKTKIGNVLPTFCHATSRHSSFEYLDKTT